MKIEANDKLADLIFDLSGIKGVWIMGKKNKMRVISRGVESNLYTYQVVRIKDDRLLYQGGEEERVKELLRK